MAATRNLGLSACLASIVGLLSGWSFAPADAATGVRAINALTSEERLRLPESTAVSVRGHTVSLREIRAVHDARERMAKNATELGRRASLLIRDQHLALTPNGEVVATETGRIIPLRQANTRTETRYVFPAPNLNGLLAGLAGRTLANSNPILSNGPIALLLPIPMPQSELRKYARDYQDFCTAAQATSCIYLPVIGSWEEANSAHNTTFGAPTQNIVDPLITDSGVCQAGGGTPSSDGCTYVYPIAQTSDFQPGAAAPNAPYAANCPVDAWVTQNKMAPQWNIVVDQHGAASAKWAINYTWPPWLIQGIPGYSGDHPATCVIQVFAR